MNYVRDKSPQGNHVADVIIFTSKISLKLMIDLWHQYTSHWSDVLWAVKFSWLAVNGFLSSASRKQNNNSFCAIFINMSCYKVILKKTSIRKMWMMQHFSYKNAKWVLNHFSSPPSALCWSKKFTLRTKKS